MVEWVGTSERHVPGDRPPRTVLRSYPASRVGLMASGATDATGWAAGRLGGAERFLPYPSSLDISRTLRMK